MPATAVDVLRIYVDTAILHYLIRPPGKKQEVKSFAALQTAADNDVIDCITSSFALLEEYDTWKGRSLIMKALKEGNIEHTSTGIRLKDNEPLAPTSRSRAVNRVSKALADSFIRKEDPASWPSDIVELFCRSSNLLWPDACHLSFSLMSRCDYFLTTDGQFFNEIQGKLNSREQKFHLQLAEKLEIILGLPRERLQKPLIKPLLLKDPSTELLLSNLAGNHP